MSQRPSGGTAQHRRREGQLFLALSLVVGVLAGLSAVLFALAIDRANRTFFGLSPTAARLFLVPSLVSVVAGILLARVFPDVRGSGVPQTKAAFHLNGGVIHPRVPAGKFLMGVLAIGSGHSLGREGPSVQIGAGIASGIGQWFRLSPARIKELVPVGAAGALSAAFNTPVAAVIFALEEIIGDLNAPLIGSTVMASVASVIVARAILGDEPLFGVPEYRLVHPAELAAYAVLGIAGGLLALIFCQGLLWTRARFLSLPAATRMWHPAVGGVIVGGMLVFVPELMGVGYESVDRALNGGLVFRTLVLLGGLKLVATIVSYASGNAGGIFAPTLFIGAMAGGALGTVMRQVAPFPTGDPGAYALVGMGALFAGIIRAPMTSVFMIFEITQDYQILVPLMVANLLSFVIARRFQPMPVYRALLRQEGVHLPSAGVRAEGGGSRAAQMMRSEELPLVPPNSSIAHALDVARAARASACLVGRSDELVGIVPVEHLNRAVDDGRGAEPVTGAAAPVRVHVHPDHPLDLVFERFAASGGLLPVVSRHNVRALEGIVTIEDITRFLQRPR
jgi:CIC family chloride channel protein